MTKIISWTCDVCNASFTPDDQNYNKNTKLEIVIPSVSIEGGYQVEIKQLYHVDDICLSCRNNLKEILDEFFNKG